MRRSRSFASAGYGKAGWCATLIAASIVVVVAAGRTAAGDPDPDARAVAPIAVRGYFGEGTAARTLSLRGPDSGSWTRADCPASGAGRFVRDHLVPQISRQFDQLGAYQAIPLTGADLDGYVMLNAVRARARDRFERGAVDAFREYLLQTTALDRLSRAVESAASPTVRVRGARFGLRAAGGLPQFEMRSALGSGRLRVRFGMETSVGLDWGPRGTVRSQLFIGYDLPGRHLELKCRLGL